MQGLGDLPNARAFRFIHVVHTAALGFCPSHRVAGRSIAQHNMQVPREGLVAKLAKLTVSQQSIESVASFCIFYAKDARGVVQIWDSEFYKAPEDRRMALLYLANHILQEGRKKGSAFQDEFYKVLPQAVTTMRASGNDKTRKSLTRLVTVWEERRVFGSRYIKSFKEALGSGSGSGGRSDVGGSGGGGGSHRGAQGPVASALSQVQQAVEASAAANSNYASAWNQVRLNAVRAGGAAGRRPCRGAFGIMAACDAILRPQQHAHSISASHLDLLSSLRPFSSLVTHAPFYLLSSAPGCGKQPKPAGAQQC